MRVKLPPAFVLFIAVASSAILQIWPLAGWIALGASFVLLFAGVSYENGSVAMEGPSGLVRTFKNANRFVQVLSGLAVFCVLASVLYLYQRNNYRLTWQLCSSAEIELVGGLPMAKAYNLGIHIFNANDFMIDAEVLENRLSLGGYTTETPLPQRSLPILPNARNAWLMDRLDFPSSLRGDEPPEGKIRYLLKYGRHGEAKNKTLLIEGAIGAAIAGDGVAAMTFNPSDESDLHFNSAVCRLS